MEQVLVDKALKSLHCLKRQYVYNCKNEINCKKCKFFDDSDLNTVGYIDYWIDIIERQQKKIKLLSDLSGIEIKGD